MKQVDLHSHRCFVGFLRVFASCRRLPLTFAPHKREGCCNGSQACFQPSSWPQTRSGERDGPDRVSRGGTAVGARPRNKRGIPVPLTFGDHRTKTQRKRSARSSLARSCAACVFSSSSLSFFLPFSGIGWRSFSIDLRPGASTFLVVRSPASLAPAKTRGFFETLQVESSRCSVRHDCRRRRCSSRRRPLFVSSMQWIDE